jgi:hypothetical protein
MVPGDIGGGVSIPSGYEGWRAGGEDCEGEKGSGLSGRRDAGVSCRMFVTVVIVSRRLFNGGGLVWAPPENGKPLAANIDCAVTRAPGLMSRVLPISSSSNSSSSSIDESSADNDCKIIRT